VQDREAPRRLPRTPLLAALLLAGAAWSTGLVAPAATDAAARPAPAPADTGSAARAEADGYSFLVTRDDGRPATFDPCREVHWVLRPDGAPDGGEQLVHRAVDLVARSTGLRFVHDGTTDEAPSPHRPVRQPDRYGERPAPVLVAWSDAQETPALAGAQLGLGVASWTGDRERLVSGQVLLDREDLTTAEGRPGRLAAATVLHELAHVVGLGHVDDPEQVMHASVLGRDEFGAGDLRGLRLLGSGPCEQAAAGAAG
jgi:hypothetical protein